MENKTLAPTAQRITFDEFLDWLTEESKADLIDGRIYAQSSPSDTQEKIFGFLLTVLSEFVSHKKLGIVRGPRKTLKFSETNGAQPDIVFISNASRNRVHQYYMDGAPEVVITQTGRPPLRNSYF